MKCPFFMLSVALAGTACANVEVNGEPGAGGAGAPPSAHERAAHEWTRLIDGAGNDWPRAITIDGAGTVALTGSTQTEGGAMGLLTTAFDAGGTERWRDVRVSPVEGEPFLLPGDIATHPQGGFVVLASLQQHPATVDAWVLRYDGEGALLWETKIPGLSAYNLAVGPGGEAWIAGSTGEHATIARVSSKGQAGIVLDEAPTKGKSAAFSGLAAREDGGIVTAYGESDATLTQSLRAELRRYDAGASLLGSSDLDCGGFLAVAGDGTIYTARGGELSGQPIILCHFDEQGELLERVEQERPASTHIGITDLAATGDGHAVLAGFAYPLDTSASCEMWARSYDGDGIALWDDAYRGPNDKFAYGQAVAVRGDRIAHAGMTSTGDGPAPYGIALRVLTRQTTPAP